MVAGVCVFDIDGTVTSNHHISRKQKKKRKKMPLRQWLNNVN